MKDGRSFEAVGIETLIPRTPTWVWVDYIVRAGINVVVGPKGVGKTSWACWLAAQASRGGEAFGGRAQRVFIDSLEDDPEVVLRPRIEAAGAAMGFIETRRPGSAAWKFPRDVAALVEYLEARERQDRWVDLIVLDSLSAYVPRLTTPGQTDETLETLTRVCERHNCGLVFVHHFNKTGRTIDSAIGGAGAVTRVARSVYIFGSEPVNLMSRLLQQMLKPSADTTPDEDEGTIVVLAAHKLNVAAKPPALRFRASAVEIAAVESVHRLDLIGETGTSAQDVFEQLRNGPEDLEIHTEIETASQWLLNYLVEGPRPTKMMIRDADSDGLSKRTIERARAKLKVESIHPARLPDMLGDEAYRRLSEDERKVWWVALPETPDAPPEEWAA
jgi:KaiC/GvpD/RAD55 family RecA-like ATPase